MRDEACEFWPLIAGTSREIQFLPACRMSDKAYILTDESGLLRDKSGQGSLAHGPAANTLVSQAHGVPLRRALT